MEENVRYRVATGKADITPNLSERTYWLADYAPGRLANSVNDPLGTCPEIRYQPSDPLQITV